VAAPRSDEREIELLIRRFLAEHHPGARRDIFRMAVDDDVWQVVGSMTLMDLVSYLEAEFAFRVRPVDFVPANFSTLARMTKFVASRRG
jgi:hypothetical protein